MKILHSLFNKQVCLLFNHQIKHAFSERDDETKQVHQQASMDYFIDFPFQEISQKGDGKN